MSKTSNNMAQVSKMIDAGWRVTGLWKNGLGTYSAAATHENGQLIERAYAKWKAIPTAFPIDEDDMHVSFFHGENEVATDDFTPEQALVRLAYKVFGECEGVEVQP